MPEYGPFFRVITPTQTEEDIEKQLQSKEIWGKPPRNIYSSDIPKVQAFTEEMPGVKKNQGIKFTTDVPPDSGSPPGQAQWSSLNPGVKIEDGYAQLKVLTIVRYP